MSSRESIIVTLRLAGQKAFAAGAKMASGALGGIGTSAERSERRVSKSTGSMSTAFGGLATMVGSGAVALGAAGTAAAAMGVKFNAGMEQTKVAFTNLLGGGKEAQAMLDRLYDLAKNTPFEFPQLAKSTQMLLGFGMSAKDVVPTMTTLGDAVAGVGGGPEQIESLTRALGQMQAKGKVSSEELLQMAEAGVPALKLLADQLGLTGAELDKKLRAGAISADQGIGALIEGMKKKYGGLAEAQSKTFSGQLSSLKDSVMQTLGAATEPLFGFLRNTVLPVVNRITDRVNAWVKAGGIDALLDKAKAVTNMLRAGFDPNAIIRGGGVGGGLGDALFKMGQTARKAMPLIKAGFAFVKDSVSELWDALKPLQPFIANILFPLLKGFAIGALGSIVGIIKLLIPIIRILAIALGWIGQKAEPLRPIFEKIGLVLGWIYGPAVFGKILTMLPKVGAAFAFIGSKLAWITKLWFGFQSIIAKAIGAVFGRLFGVVAGHFGKIAAFLGRIPGKWLDLGRRAAQALLRGLVSAFAKGTALASNIGGALVKWINDNTPFGDTINLPKPLPDIHLPALAGGGVMPWNGAALVGEQGPELVSLRKGMHVTPNERLALASARSGPTNVTTRVYLKDREIAQAVGTFYADQRARA